MSFTATNIAHLIVYTTVLISGCGTYLLLTRARASMLERIVYPLIAIVILLIANGPVLWPSVVSKSGNQSDTQGE